MARVTGPLMSFDASGSIAGAVVFSKWRGRNYVRRHAVPSNPRSDAQLTARSIIAFCGAVWKLIDPEDQVTWEAGAESQKISAFNEYIRVNARNWRDQFCPSVIFPAARTAAPGTNTLDTPVVSGRQVQIACTYAMDADDWGIALCRSMSTGFTGSPANVVLIAPAAGFAELFVDGPLDPGEYFYDSFVFSLDGKMGALTGHVSAVVS